MCSFFFQYGNCVLTFFQVELSIGRFPYTATRNVFEQLKQVVQNDPPRLPEGQFSPQYEEFIALW